jgi:hypothetical protein
MNVIQHDGYPLAVSKKLVAIITQELEMHGTDIFTGFIINFRGPDYSAESGGYHPVEICVDANGRIQYITDFAYVGQGHYAELAKELDFDFSGGVFQQMGTVFPIRQGAGLFKMWQSNFCSYYKWQVFKTSIESL